MLNRGMAWLRKPRKWTMCKAGALTLVVMAVVAVVVALPWDSWLDVIGLVLGVTNLAMAGAIFFYVYRVEANLIDATLTEAEVVAMISAKRRIEGW